VKLNDPWGIFFKPGLRISENVHKWRGGTLAITTPDYERIGKHEGSKLQLKRLKLRPGGGDLVGHVRAAVIEGDRGGMGK